MAISPKRRMNRPATGGGAPDEPATERPRAERRLTRGDWIDAGQDILRHDGVAALKLAALTKRLGVSTGSFYHHFSDFESYLGALADAYSMDSVQGVLDRTSFDHPDPLTRIRKLARLSIDEGTFELDRAMRIWATMDGRAAVTVRKAEGLVLAFLAEAFRDLGFDDEEAQLRARVLLSVNVAPVCPREPEARRTFFKDCLRLLSGRDD